MKINVLEMSARLEQSVHEDIPVLKLCIQTTEMSHAIQPFIFGVKNIALFCDQLSGKVKWYDLVAFNGISYNLFPHSGGVQIYCFSGRSSKIHYVHIPGELLAERIKALNIKRDPIFELSFEFFAEELKEIAWKKRSRSALYFVTETTKERLLVEIRGEFGTSLRKCIRSEMKALRRHSDGQVVTLFVSLDHHGFYFEAFDAGRRLFNGGWIKHEKGYSSHH